MGFSSQTPNQVNLWCWTWGSTTVPAGAVARCPPRPLCPSRWPQRRAAPSRRSAALGCRRPAQDPMSTGTPGMIPHALTAPWYLQCLQEAEGAQTPASGHDAEGGVVQQLLVVKPGRGRGVKRGLSTIRSPAMKHSAQSAPKSPSPKTALSPGTAQGGLQAVHPPGCESPFCATAGKGIHRALRPHRKSQY